MIGDGRNEDRQHDRQRSAEFCCEEEGKQLRFVADFGEGNDAGRNEECFHVGV